MKNLKNALCMIILTLAALVSKHDVSVRHVPRVVANVIMEFGILTIWHTKALTDGASLSGKAQKTLLLPHVQYIKQY